MPLEEVLDEALEVLSTYSLIQWKEEQDGYSMHKLVHAWSFDRLEAGEQGQYSLSSLAFLLWVTRERQLDPARKSRIFLHISLSVTRLQEWHRTPMQVSKDSLETMWLLANFVRNMGQYQTELELRAFEEAERGRAKEQDQARWLHSLSDLAVVHLRHGKYEAAEEMNR